MAPTWAVPGLFFDTPEVTKIVLLKVLQNSEDPKLCLLVQGTEPKRFPA